MRKLAARLLPRGRLVRRFVMLSGTAALGQALMVLATPLLTRLYAPDDFGSVAVLIMLAGILTFAAGWRYDAAIPLAREEEDALALVRLVVGLAAIGALLVAVLLFAAQAPLARLLGLTDGTVLWWLPVLFFLNGVFLAFNGWALHADAMRDLAFSKAMQWAVVAGAQVGLGFASSGNPHALAAGFALGQLASVAPMFVHLGAGRWRRLLRPAPRRMIRQAARYRRFPLFGSWALLLNNAAVLLPLPLVSAVFGAGMAGQYGVAQRVTGVPIRFVGIAVSQVYTAEIAPLAQADRARLAALFDETVRRLLVLGMLYLGAVALFGPALFALVFGEAWREGGVIARLLAPMYLMMFLNQPIQYTLQFFERQDLALITNGGSLAIVLACFLAAQQGLLDQWTTILLMSLGLGCSYAGSFVFAWLLIHGRLAPGRGDRHPVGESAPGPSS